MRDIVVGLGSRGGGLALAWATEETTRTGGSLVICHAYPPQSMLVGRGPTVPIAVLELADPGVARAVTAARARLGGDRVLLRVRAGRPEALLLDEAAHAGLVVLGRPGGAARAGLRSTVHRVAARSPCPVVVARAVCGGRDAVFAGHVVVGVDGSAAGRAALEFGFGWAAAHRRPLAAVHVTSDQREDFWYDETTLSAHFTREPASLDVLAVEVEPWMHRYPEVTVKRASYAGSPLPGLVRAARGASLAVVGDHDRPTVIRAMLGSVTDGFLDGAPCPVAVVRSPAPWRERRSAGRAGLAGATAQGRHQIDGQADEQRDAPTVPRTP